jgi:hypothetical protein
LSTEPAVQRRRATQTLESAESLIASQVPENRREEIRRYLELFGYNPGRSILQVHLAGSFGRTKRTSKELAVRERTATRYQGRTFTILGRTHDPSFIKKLIPPRTRRGQESNPGYLGYLWKKKDEGERPPDELIPLDFVPASLRYPRDWKDEFHSPGYLLAMHVSSDFARYKNDINNRLRRIRGDVDVKKEWRFLDELTEYGYDKKKIGADPTEG